MTTAFHAIKCPKTISNFASFFIFFLKACKLLHLTISMEQSASTSHTTCMGATLVTSAWSMVLIKDSGPFGLGLWTREISGILPMWQQTSPGHKIIGWVLSKMLKTCMCWRFLSISEIWNSLFFVCNCTCMVMSWAVCNTKELFISSDMGCRLQSYYVDEQPTHVESEFLC